MGYRYLPGSETIASSDELPRMLQVEEQRFTYVYDDKQAPSTLNWGKAATLLTHCQLALRPIKWLSIAIIAGSVLAHSRAFAGDGPECIHRKVLFDGIAPLRYSTVIGETGSKEYLHHDYPAQCSGAAPNACKADAYVVSGDAVAIGKSCGAWDYVQYIGTTRVSRGWIAADAVEAHAGAPIEGFKIEEASVPFPQSKGYHFKLTRGRGVPVCEAYLQRLNVSHYEKPPYCGRPEDDSVPGFSKLTRVPLEPSEVNKLYKYAFNFLFPRPQHEPSAFTDIREGRTDVTQEVGHGLAVWRYNPRVDLENDGMPDNVIVWHGLWSSSAAVQCGEDFSSTGVGLRVVQAPLVFNAKDEGVDEKTTDAIIGHPVPHYDSSLPTGNLYIDESTFRTIARAIGIFRYRDKYYFDGFFDIWGDAENKRRGEPQLANTLAVFAHEAHITRQICEYRMGGADYPRP
jgi:hypothetical protein